MTRLLRPQPDALATDRPSSNPTLFFFLNLLLSICFFIFIFQFFFVLTRKKKTNKLLIEANQLRIYIFYSFIYVEQDIRFDEFYYNTYIVVDAFYARDTYATFLVGKRTHNAINHHFSPPNPVQHCCSRRSNESFFILMLPNALARPFI